MDRARSFYDTLKDSKITKVNSGYKNFPIIIVDNLRHNDEKVYGVTDFGGCKIFLEENMSYDEAVSTLTHEIFHIIANSVGLDPVIKDDPCRVDNEFLVGQFTNGFIQFIRLNKNLASTLFNRIEYIK